MHSIPTSVSPAMVIGPSSSSLTAPGSSGARISSACSGCSSHPWHPTDVRMHQQALLNCSAVQDSSSSVGAAASGMDAGSFTADHPSPLGAGDSQMSDGYTPSSSMAVVSAVVCSAPSVSPWFPKDDSDVFSWCQWSRCECFACDSQVRAVWVHAQQFQLLRLCLQ